MECIEYNFKKDAKIYIVTDNKQYNIDVSEINFNQTLMEHSYSNKTIQDQNMFEQSIINKANPANFDLAFYALREADFRILFDKALDYSSFDLYVVTQSDMFRIEGCVITNADFSVERMNPLNLKITGEGIILTILPIATVIPGVVQTRSGTHTYNRVSDLEVSLGNTNGTFNLSEYTSSFSLELQNEVKWTPYTTINSAISSTTMYPTSYTISKRILAGSITQYLTDTNNTNLLQWHTNSTLDIKIGQDTGTFYGFVFTLGKCSFTNRVGSNNIFTQSYDWRLLENPGNLSSIISYNTIP